MYDLSGFCGRLEEKFAFEVDSPRNLVERPFIW